MLRRASKFFFSSRRRHTRSDRDWSSDVCSSDLEVQRTLAKDSRAYTRLRKAPAAVQAEVLLPTPIRTLSNYDPVKRRARLLVTSDGSGPPGGPYPPAAELLEPLGWTFQDRVARYTPIYQAP